MGRPPTRDGRDAAGRRRPGGAGVGEEGQLEEDRPQHLPPAAAPAAPAPSAAPIAASSRKQATAAALPRRAGAGAAPGWGRGDVLAGPETGSS